jgi:neutral ceramidase
MAPTSLHVGFATRDITPPRGIPLAGYGAREGVSSGSLDGIHARAMVVEDRSNGTRLAFVVADLVAFSPETIRAFRERVEIETGFADDDVILAVTHTHSGPAYGALFGLFGGSGSAREPEASIRWGQELPGALLAVLRDAASASREATVAVGSTRVALSTHRRLKDPLGEIRLAPNPAGVTDPEVHVFHARAADDGAAIGTLVTHACHPVVLCEDNLLYSGDFPSYLIAALEAEGAAAVYLNGACGDVNPARRGDAATAREHGEALARAVRELLPNLAPAEARPIARSAEEVALPLRLPSDEDLQAYRVAAEGAFAQHADPSNFEGRRLAAEVRRARDLADRLGRRRARLADRIAGDVIMVRLQAARIGPALFAALPGETFVELGLALRAATDSEHVFVLGYTNDSIGYVPTRSAYDEGGYEVVSSHLAPGAGELLGDAALAALERLVRAPVEGA